MVDVVEALHDRSGCLPGDVAKVAGLLGVAGQRLLAQHVLPGLEGGHVPLGVEGVDQRVVDDIDLGISNDLGVGLVHRADAVLLGESFGAATVARSDGDQLVAQHPRGLDDAFLRDPRGAKDSNTQRGTHALTSTDRRGAATTTAQ